MDMEGFNSSMALPFSYVFSTTTAIDHNNNNVIAAPNNPWMDSRIWSKLPPRLLDRVMAFLPPPAFFRFRSVSKRCYSLLFSDRFLDLYLQISPLRHWFIFFNHNITPKSYIYGNTNTNINVNHDQYRTGCEGYLFDPNDMTWYRICFPLVPSGFSPASSSGGLICWLSDAAGPKTLVLCNPIVGSFTQLPQTLRPRLFPSIGLSVTPTSIHVAVAGDDLISPYAVKNLSAESFHIDAGGFYSIWGTESALPRLCNLESGRMVRVEGRFFAMNYSPFSVLALEVSSNSWQTIQAPMRRFLRSPCLVEIRGRLVMVAAVEKSKLNVPRSLRVWALQECGAAWVEIERMPQPLYVQMAEMERGAGFECVGHGEFIVIMIRGGGNWLLFDICRKRWQWMPPCPYVLDAGDLRGYAYQPKLATPVTALLHQLALPFQPYNNA